MKQLKRADPESIAGILQKEFPYTPTAGQERLIKALAMFLCSETQNPVFVIRGYAGTGKTTLVSALVKILPLLKTESVLLAPTGRAAKVLAAYSGKTAYTIHKKIYMIRSATDGSMRLLLQSNIHRDAIFIVDEASMITDNAAFGDGELFSGNKLLEDLFTFVNNGTNCRLIFIGDIAQLPPVGSEVSPALDNKYLTASYHVKAEMLELTDVVRQAVDSGILVNATAIRSKIDQKDFKPPFFTLKGFADLERINGLELEEVLQTAYSASGKEEMLIVCRSNKRANIYNREIRNRIFGFDSELAAGDMLMCVRNNYFWLPSSSQAGFIANGDIMEVMRVRKVQELYGFRFADVQVRLLDYPEEKDLDIKVFLDTLSLDAAAFSWKDNRKLFDNVMADYADIPQKFQRVRKVKENPFFNAVQVKYAYALTCHKSQGGQWQQVFVEQGYLTPEMLDLEYMRWLYTAVTRATKKLYLVNYSEKFFADFN